MLSTDDSSDEEKEDVDKSSIRLRSISGDDLGDSFSVEEDQSTKKGWVDEIMERRDAEGSENEDDDSSGGSGSDGEDDDDEEESEEDGADNDSGEEADEKSGKFSSLKDWEQSDDDDIVAGEQEDEDNELYDDKDDENEKMDPRNKKSKMTKGRDVDTADIKKMKEDGSLPALIEAPKTFEELCALLENHSNKDVIELIRRIRVNNAIKLAAENRKKMQV